MQISFGHFAITTSWQILSEVVLTADADLELMQMFTPYSALIGGVLIGLASVLLMLLNGRVAGISGILAAAMQPPAKEAGWRWTFIIGLVSGPILVWLFTGSKPAFDMQAGWVSIIVGGLLVGFGTRLGSGCTSGHGVCGLARLSVRSLAAVVVFMVAGMLTVGLVRSLAGFS